MGKNDDGTASGYRASVTHLLAKAYGLPIVKLDTRTLRYDGNKGVVGEIGTQWGDLFVEIRYGFVYCRGDQNTLVKNGIVKPEWLPGTPGNGRFSHSVVVDETGEQAAESKTKVVVEKQRIYLRVWGHSPPTVEVRLPMTDEVQKAIESWKAQMENKLSEAVKITHTVAPRYRTSGNVVYLRPRD